MASFARSAPYSTMISTHVLKEVPLYNCPLDCGLRPFQALGVCCMLEATGINRLRNRAAHTCCWEATGPRTVHQEFYLEEQLRMKNY